MPQTIVTTDTPIPAPAIPRGPTHTLSVLVSNEPGVLMRICQVFSRRGFNIDSLVVSEGRNANFSRMTIGISGDPQGLSQIIMQVGKLIDVIHCSEHTDADAVVKELIMVKFLASESQQTQALQIIEHFGGKTVDLSPTSMIALVSGNSSKIDAAISMFSQFEIIETVRTGKVVMARGEQPT
ncbi:MAG: acetolactate synthase small subunit [Verrucomicrobiota bacterium]|jgi:acetolactate synthase-1/3 small subunit